MTDDQRPTGPPRRPPRERRRGEIDRRHYAVGDRVRLSAAGKARLRQMPEAWGMHAAAARDEVGEVIEVIEGEDGLPAALSVEFDTGSVYNWDIDQFVLDTASAGEIE